MANAQGYLNYFDWKCLGGMHTGRAVIEAENKPEARLSVPPLVRSQARAVNVAKFDAAMFAHMHEG